ncbi:hypothetical protein R3P38DRAFT_3272601 [Favolaschia claudopus]|uniref:Uncharacterized protein n=1 Tax=Favolaschia claudopus TaxID=2862362 RepID=A0AAW0B2Y3_9AGAR
MPPRKSSAAKDVILPMTNDYMQQIVDRDKTHEFRRYLISPSVKRVWFYLNAPESHLQYICEIDPAHTRNLGDPPLPEEGAGNKEFNARHKDWDKYDFAYRILSVRELSAPIKLAEMRDKYGMKSAPRGLVYVPEGLLSGVKWEEQRLLWSVDQEKDEENQKDACPNFPTA